MLLFLWLCSILAAVCGLWFADEYAPGNFYQLGERLAAVCIALFFGAGFLAAALFVLSF